MCRNRKFFVTKNAATGIGSLNVPPFALIVLIHGLKTPFVLSRAQEDFICHGDCYVHGLIGVELNISDEDVYLDII